MRLKWYRSFFCACKNHQNPSVESCLSKLVGPFKSVRTNLSNYVITILLSGARCNSIPEHFLFRWYVQYIFSQLNHALNSCRHMAIVPMIHKLVSNGEERSIKAVQFESIHAGVSSIKKVHEKLKLKHPNSDIHKVMKCKTFHNPFNMAWNNQGRFVKFSQYVESHGGIAKLEVVCVFWFMSKFSTLPVFQR